MPAPKLFVFDAYGTLFDVHGPARLLADELGPVAEQLSEIWRVKQLEYSWLRGLMGRYVPFSEVTREALSFAFGACGLAENRPLEKRLMQAYQSVPAYPDVVPTLDALLKAGRKTAILTNGSKNMIGSAVKNADLESRITAILSVDDVKTFKPHPSVYQMVLDRFAVETSDVCFITSNGWDAAGAGAFGFRVVWLNRFNRTPETLGPSPNAVVSNMTSLPGLFA